MLLGLFVGLPIVWSMLLSSTLSLIVDGRIPIVLIAQRMFAGCDVFVLLAVPAFILAGDIMAHGGISKRIATFADSLVGWISGGLSIVSIVSCTFFAAVSGSSIATTATVGKIMIPEMEKRGYKTSYSAAIQSVGGTLGIVIPPSIPFVMYGSSTNVSIGDLLISGIIPGLIACFVLCLVCYVIAKRDNLPKENRKSFKEVCKAFIDAFWALLTPVIIIGGIYAGIFTPTESAVVAVVYGFIASCLIYKELPIKNMLKVLKGSATTSANLIILICAAQFFSYMITRYRLAIMLSNAFLSTVSTPFGFLCIVFVLLLIAGMFIDAGSIILILGVMLAPIAVKYGIDPVHFGLVFVFLCAVGQSTPPFGVCLFTASSISDASVAEISKKAIPFIGAELLCAILFMFVPQISTWLPSLLK